MSSEVKDAPAIDVPDYAPEPAGRVDAALSAVHGAAATARDSVGDAYGVTRGAVSDGYAAVRGKASVAYGGVAERVAPALDAARESVSHVYEAAREQSTAALGSARETLSQAKEKTVQSIEDSPLAIIVGGIALGAALGAALPRSNRETELLAPLGGKLNDAARGAFSAAKTAAFAKLDEFGISGDAARAGIQKLASAAGETARAAGEAAAASAKGD